MWVVDRKPEEHARVMKRILDRQSLVEDSEEALGTVAPTWTEVVKKKTARKKNSPMQGEQINGTKRKREHDEG